MLVATFLCCSLSYHKVYRHTIQRNLVVIGLGVALLYYLDPVVAPQLLIQFIAGFGGSGFFGYYFHQARILRFFVEETNQQQKHYAYKELAKVVPPHVVKHIEQGLPLESSMPTGFGEAFVMSFDVIGSSTIKNPGYPAAMDRFMTQAYALMMENYNGRTLTANAYRIKDTGDGFLCSIGYPYAVPPGQKAQDLAVELGVKFIEIFKDTMDKLDYELPIACAVGISHGTVEAFFPGAGVKQYDLRGFPLALATRYESLRKLLIIDEPVLASYLILQEAVYQKLPKVTQALFTHYDATRPGRAIRDDIGAKSAFYRTLPHSLPAMKQSA
jgi:hypothetical protein